MGAAAAATEAIAAAPPTGLVEGARRCTTSFAGLADCSPQQSPPAQATAGWKTLQSTAQHCSTALASRAHLDWCGARPGPARSRAGAGPSWPSTPPTAAAAALQAPTAWNLETARFSSPRCTPSQASQGACGCLHPFHQGRAPGAQNVNHQAPRPIEHVNVTPPVR